MIDLHSHILPGLCDGSQNLETSLAMARMAVADGTTHLACTPHIYPGLYNNNQPGIASAIDSLQIELNQQDIPLTLVMGADVHMVPEVMRGLKNGMIPTLNQSRYFLLEPSHHVPVSGFIDQIENFLNADYVPVITHPERLRWLGDKYEEFLLAARMGAWLQITAGAITGHFGRTARQFSERLLLDGYVHIIASDAHGTDRRPPILSAGIQAAIQLLGDETEVMRMVQERPQAILDNASPDTVSLPPALALSAGHELTASHFHKNPTVNKKNWFSRLFG